METKELFFNPYDLSIEGIPGKTIKEQMRNYEERKEGEKDSITLNLFSRSGKEQIKLGKGEISYEMWEKDVLKKGDISLDWEDIQLEWKYTTSRWIGYLEVKFLSKTQKTTFLRRKKVMFEMNFVLFLPYVEFSAKARSDFQTIFTIWERKNGM